MPITLLAILAYVPALLAAPGRMPADSKLYLYLDPGRLIADATGTFDPRQFAGWVPHQHISFIWPSGPWFWGFDLVGAPDWIAHRLWIGTLLLAAGLGARWCARLLGLAAPAALAAAVVYQVSPYVLPYVSRTSVMLLPWAGLGWIVGLTVRASRRGGWRDPALIALVVLTVGAVNATALAMIVPAPVVWLVHAAWARLTTWRTAVGVAARTGVLSLAVSLWWFVALVVQGRHGADVLRYSERLADVSHTATSAEVWRGLGYWLFYVRDPYAATTTESLRYLASSPALIISFTVPIVCLIGLVWVRWIHRRFAALLVATGVVLAVGVHPIDEPSPLMSLLTGGGESGLALALRSSTRALPVMNLGLALAAGSLVGALAGVRWRAWRVERIGAVAVSLLVLANLPGLWAGALVDPALERDQDPPDAWLEAAASLDRSGSDGRVLMLPGIEFGAYRWGYTVDQPLPGLSERAVLARDLLPLGSPAAMDLLFAFDDRFQAGVAEPEALDQIARLLGVDTVWLTNDVAYERFRTARPEVVRDVVTASDAVVDESSHPPAASNVPDVAMTDERAIADQRVGAPLPAVELVELDGGADIARVYESTLVVAGSGAGLVDAAAGGLLTDAVGIRYSADEPDPATSDIGVLVTDSNRDRDRHWRNSQDPTGFTETGGDADDLLGDGPPDARLPVFDTDDPSTQTVAIHEGPVAAVASAYGEPFAYTPEHRAVMAVDGDPATAWLVGEHGDPVGESIELGFADHPGGADGTLVVRQPDTPDARRITSVVVTEGSGEGFDPSTARTIPLGPESSTRQGQPIEIGDDTTVARLTIDSVGGGEPATAGAVAGVGFAELDLGIGPTDEVVVAPAPPEGSAGLPYGVALTRLRVDPMDRWRSDPEPALVRQFEVPDGRRFEPAYTVRIDARASDAELADVFGWPVAASSRLTGSLRSAGVSAFDGDPESAWITAFGSARGATLRVADVSEPVTAISIVQPDVGLSTVTAVEVRSGAETRRVAVEPDGAGGATVAIDPPLPAGTVEIEIVDIDPATTVDRRFADTVELPAAIGEIGFEGAPDVAPIGTEPVGADCVPVADLDGTQLAATLSVRGSAWLDGAPVEAAPCDDALELGPGTHTLRGRSDVWQLDRVTLDGALGAALTSVEPPPTAIEVDAGRFGATYEIADCPDGCWFTYGMGHNDAWSATADGDDLGSPAIVDGGFNGWWVPPTDGPVTVDVRWTAQRALTIALVVSGIAAIMCLALVVGSGLRSRRHARSTGHVRLPDPQSDVSPSNPKPRPAPVLAIGWAPLGPTEAAVLAGGWCLLGLVLVGPSGGLLGAVGGLALWVTKRRDLPALTALATVIATALYVTVNERRWAPLPDGGWPVRFEAVHDFGMFAAVSLLIAAFAADDRGVGDESCAREQPPTEDGAQLPSPT